MTKELKVKKVLEPLMVTKVLKDRKVIKDQMVVEVLLQQLKVLKVKRVSKD